MDAKLVQVQIKKWVISMICIILCSLLNLYSVMRLIENPILYSNLWERNAAAPVDGKRPSGGTRLHGRDKVQAKTMLGASPGSVSYCIIN